jgi:predicted permease
MGSFRNAARDYYRRLLNLYPDDFRAEYGGEMQLLFRDRARREPILPLLWETTVDTFKTAPKEHVSMLFKDVRYALRGMARNPMFTLVAVLSLALGIGANSAMFSLADAMLLRPLPVPEYSEVVSVREVYAAGTEGSISWPNFVDLREKTKSFQNLVAYTLVPFGMTSKPDEPAKMKVGFLVSGNFFDALRVTPALGRGFRADEDQVPGRDAVVVLSYDTWKGQFDGDPGVVGRTIRLNGIEFNVIGVAPESFTGMDQFIRPALYVPAAMSPRLAGNPDHDILTRRGHRAMSVKGRLKPGVSVEQARAEISTLGKALESAYPEFNRDRALTVMTELATRVDRSTIDAALIALLMGLVSLVLLIACANVANMMLSRGQSRAKEIAVRLAVGASRGRLVRQLLTESLLIALIGGIVGVGVAFFGVRLVSQVEVPTDVPIVIKPQLDARLLLFALGASVVSALLFGLIPALASVKRDVIGAIKASPTEGSRKLTGRNLLVVAQLALSLVLLMSAGLMISGFKNMLASKAAFRQDHLLMMSFDPSLVRYSEQKTQEFYQRLIDRARVLPGVQSATLMSVMPMGNQQGVETIAPENVQLGKDQREVTLFSSTVEPSYFDTMQIPIVKGRAFTDADRTDTPGVAIVNEALAEKYWKGDAIGKRFKQGEKMVEIVGVAKNSRYLWISEPPTSFLYRPLKQNYKPRMTLAVQTAGDSGELVVPLRELVRSIDVDLPVYNVITMESFFEKRVIGTFKMLGETVSAMGLIGLVLSLVGLYAVVAYSVSRRTREIGIRMAIGAGRDKVLSMVLGQGLKLALIGVAIGLVLSYAVQRLLEAAFLGGEGGNWLLYILIPAILLLVTTAAAWIPALRASRVDPLNALRYE